MAHFMEDNDSDGEIPEVDLTLHIQPYMFEPLGKDRSTNTCNSLSESDHHESHSESGRESPTSSEDVTREPVESWCNCGNCVEMPTSRENKCCRNTNIVNGKVDEKSLQCITEHEGFIVNCLNHYVLETSYYEYIQDNGRQNEREPIHELYRHLAYRRFVRWVYHILGKKNRRILPSCVVSKIRQTFPSQTYCGFKYPE
ncbi:P2X purinoceptor 7-like [Saccostrea cucullata]|uniref:P2X purinoceptor 7-like n=1 Tax=Saccostrea cuccullata TaxID=36930 RepID=UPI002ED2785E